MAGLALPPGFGTNSFNEEKWSRAQAIATANFLVEGPTSWRPTASATTDRTINIAPGRGYGCGVYDETTGVETIQFDPNPTGSIRYDYLVARFDWTTNTRVFAKIKGGFNPPPPNLTQVVDVSSVNRIPGLQYDGIIAMAAIRPNVGTFNSGDVIDMRLWTSGGGLATANIGNPDFLGYVDVVEGSTVFDTASDRTYRKVDAGTGPWTFAGGPPRIASFRTIGQLYSNGTSKLLGWGAQIDGETDFVKYVGNGDFQFTRAGIYSMSCVVDSDPPVPGRSRVVLGVSGAYGGFGSVADDRARPTRSDFAGSQALTQSLTTTPLLMNVGSSCNVEVFQFNPTNSLVAYTAALNIAQVPG